MQATTPIRSIAVERDVEGLRTALRELFEESYLENANGEASKMWDVEAFERMQEDMPERTLSPGYYSRAIYLLDLASGIETGVTYAASDVSRADVQGLTAIRHAKSDFERDHPQCPGCGIRLESRFLSQCLHCKTKFAGKGN